MNDEVVIQEGVSGIQRAANFFPQSFLEWLGILVIIVFVIWVSRQLYLKRGMADPE